MTWQEQLIVVAPWFSGGLAGAILTLLTKSLSERRKRLLASLRLDQTVYRLPASALRKASGKHELGVTYNGKPYDSLFACTAKVRASSSTLPSFAIHFLHSEDDEILSTFSQVKPIPTETAVTRHSVEGVFYIEFSIPPLQSGDEVSVGFLANGRRSEIEVLVRGAGEITFRTSNDSLWDINTSLTRPFLVVLSLHIGVVGAILAAKSLGVSVGISVGAAILFFAYILWLIVFKARWKERDKDLFKLKHDFDESPEEDFYQL